jgi:hypothetical protein
MVVEFPDDDIPAKRSRGISIDCQSMCVSVNAVASFRLILYPCQQFTDCGTFDENVNLPNVIISGKRSTGCQSMSINAVDDGFHS